MTLGDSFPVVSEEAFLFKAFLYCFVLFSSRLFFYIIGADGRLAMPLVFSLVLLYFPLVVRPLNF